MSVKEAQDIMVNDGYGNYYINESYPWVYKGQDYWLGSSGISVRKDENDFITIDFNGGYGGMRPVIEMSPADFLNNATVIIPATTSTTTTTTTTTE